MSEKYKNFVNESLKSMDELGRISMHTEILGKLTNIYKALLDLINSQHVKQEHRQLLAFMNDKLSNIKFLYGYCHDTPDIHRFCVTIFPDLNSLKLNRVPPSTIEGIYALKDQLHSVDIVNSGITDLSKSFAPIDVEFLNQLTPLIMSKEKIAIPESLVWSQLKVLKIVNCGLSRLDASFHLFPNLTNLDLSNNQIAHIAHLHDCFSLRYLNLSNNKISILSNLDRLLGNIISLNLSMNKIESLDGIERMITLQNLNISNNLIQDMEEMEYLTKLPILETLDLFDNPIGSLEQYRMAVYMSFVFENATGIYNLNRELPILDGQAIDHAEKLNLKRIVAELNSNSDFDEEHALSVDSFSPLISSSGASDLKPSSSDSLPIKSRSTSHQQRTSSGGSGISPLASLTVIQLPKCDPYALLSWQDKRYDNCSQTCKALRKVAVIHDENSENVDASPFPTIEDIKNELMRKKSMIKPMESVANYANTIINSKLSSSKEAPLLVGSLPKESVIKVDIKLESSLDNVKDAPCDIPNNSSASSSPAALETSLDESMVAINNSFTIGSNIKQIQSNVMDDVAISSPNRNTRIASYDVSSSPILTGQFTEIPSRTSSDEIGLNSSTDNIHYGGIGSGLNSNVRFYRDNSPIKRLSTDTRTNSVASVSPYVFNADQDFNMEDIESEGPPNYSKENKSIQSSESGGAGKLNFQFVMQYTGDTEYEELTILENLDLYFREQVFGPRRTTGEIAYLQMKSNEYNIFDNPDKLLISAPPKQEKFMALFVENVIDHQNKLFTKEKEKEPESVPMSSSFIGSVSQSFSNVGNTLSSVGRNSFTPQNEEADGVTVENSVLIVLSDCRLYFIDINEILPGALFHEAVVPVVLRYHELFALRSITINFGFQRCAFTFAETEGREIGDAFYDCMNNPNDNTLDELTYFIITREKSRTYPMITKIPQIANAYRATINNKRLKNVIIRNKDPELVGAVSQVAHELGADPDISHYQMLFRIFRDRPNVAIPMTVILTPNLLILAEEDLSYNGIKMKIIDTSDIKEVYKIQAEESPFLVTIIFKPTSVFSAKRKWRLKCDSKAAATRLNEEIRRSCISHGNTDVIDSSN